jgi:hypothetical protein
LSGVAEEPASEAKVERRWQHPSEAVVDEEAGELVPGAAAMLASRSFARSSTPKKGLTEPRIYGPAATREALANSFHPDERRAPLGEGGDPEGGCTRCFGAECALTIRTRQDSGFRARVIEP